MAIGNMNDIALKPIKSSEALDASIRVLVSPKEGWKGYVMREIEVEKNGYTPKHFHPWPHINYIIEGEGSLYLEGVETSVKAGSFAYIPANSLHQFKNVGDTTFKFICIVPEEGHQY